MVFEYTPPQTPLEIAFGGFHHINMYGSVNAGDEAKFRAFLETSAPPPRTPIFINSPGGNVEAAIEIGRLIRDGWFSTSIGTYTLGLASTDAFTVPRKFVPGKCISAATLIFLGGRLRHFNEGSEFGVHQFSYKDPSPDSLSKSQQLSAKIAKYIEDMGIPAAFLETSASTLGNDLSLLSEQQLRALKVITDGEDDVKWGVEVHPDVMWVRGERDSIYGHGKVLLIYGKTQGFSFCALVETMGRHTDLMTFGLVEIVVNGDDIRIDITDRCARSPSGIYTMFMANLSDQEAGLLANSQSFGIQIRSAPDVEIFLGIAAVSTQGGEDKLKGLYMMGSRN